MINEKQAFTLLNECEDWLGAKLDNLRHRLKFEHEKTKSTLWELITLHAIATSVISRCVKNQNICSLVQHEPTDASPDIILSPNDCEPFDVEITYTESQNNDQQEKHPIYTVIKKKADQAKKWNQSRQQDRSLVIIIGIQEKGYNLTDKYQRAIYSALADLEKWDLTTIFNYTYDRTWIGARRRYRVSGSKLISAIVVVTFKNEFKPFTYICQKKASKPFIVRNPHSTFPLTDLQECFLQQVDFNQINYGSSLENWERVNNRKVLSNKHLIESEGYLSFSPKGSWEFIVEIPCKILTNLLVGNIDFDEAWGIGDKSKMSEITLAQQVGICFKTAIHIRSALSLPISIINIGFVEEDPKLRGESRVAIETGRISAIENIDEELLTSFSVNSDGSFIAKIPSDFVFCILSGKFKAIDAWNCENRKELGEFLKNAVNKGQKITKIGFVQNSNNSTYESYIVLEFGMAVEKSIRENKQVLKKLKESRKNIRDKP